MIICLFHKELINIEDKLKLIQYKELEQMKQELKDKIDYIFENELKRRKLL